MGRAHRWRAMAFSADYVRARDEYHQRLRPNVLVEARAISRLGCNELVQGAHPRSARLEPARRADLARNAACRAPST